MKPKQSKKRSFSGMSYRDVQRSNSNRKSKLPKQQQKWLKESGYRNVGWDNIIQLYQKINELLAEPDSDEPTLEELFLKADQIGNKYQTPEEIEAFQQQLSTEVEAIADTIDRQFPDTEIESIDYGKQAKPTTRRKRS
ncbi:MULTISPECIES: hypothetical protein [unclassified Leptolyngbya]|uniref:hypothetical protein n=1 Tax=unclassified Leptolyngbya TaxID=2650499 RepID=UPI001689B3D5|nr:MULTISPECIES: hypothetical protein [unclassified Leptolyngbya]MBD1913511.1 hypothetical protein [Leptolyngbya sp. FACHB-8]MBD2153267.1 hypothetical protein [Leptolyngbya sp. FACHB-16]